MFPDDRRKNIRLRWSCFHRHRAHPSSRHPDRCIQHRHHRCASRTGRNTGRYSAYCRHRIAPPFRCSRCRILPPIHYNFRPFHRIYLRHRLQSYRPSLAARDTGNHRTAQKCLRGIGHFRLAAAGRHWSDIGRRRIRIVRHRHCNTLNNPRQHRRKERIDRRTWTAVPQSAARRRARKHRPVQQQESTYAV